MSRLIFFTIFTVSTCGLIYELVAGTISSYLLGDSVTQFSTVIGVYLFSMGVGAFLSKYIQKNLVRFFIQVEFLTGIVGGFSSIILFLSFGSVESFRVILYALVLLTGVLVGLEIPLMMRILKDRLEFKDLVSKVFTFDYIGALLASLLFPLLLVPYFGLIRTSVFFGIVNVSLAIYLSYYFRSELKKYQILIVQGIVLLFSLLIGFVFSTEILSFSESQVYGENVIFSTSSRYQRIVLTRKNTDLRLYLNGNLQFSSMDEYRYHESLVHPVMRSCEKADSILILGGGDGMAVREVLKYPHVKHIFLVDLDKKMTELFSTNHILIKLNSSSLCDKRTTVVNDDAFEWLKKTNRKFDVVIIDFPDPSNYAVGKLFTNTFYSKLRKVMKPSTVCVVQSTSPLVAPRSFWCVNNTIHSVGYETRPYHAYVPSFGEWGFILFSQKDITLKNYSYLPRGLRYYSDSEFAVMLKFPRDMIRNVHDIQKLDNQILVEHFEKEWENYQ
jgi:spermidine synthase